MSKLFLLARLTLPVLLILAPCAHAQQPKPDAPPDTPTQTNLPTDAPLNPALPTVFIVGDSTARNGANLGWGDHFAHLFDTSRINVANRAMAGRSSRTFSNEGRWDKVLAEMKPGDFLLLQMGHNDSGDLGGAKPRGTLHSIGEETQAVPQTAGPLAGTTEIVHTYGWYLRKYIDETKAKGATPAILTLTVRNIWTPGPDGRPHIERDFGYTAFIQQVAKQEHIQLIDMGTLEANAYEKLGPTATAPFFPKDHTHTSPEGAELNAEAVAQAIRLAKSPLAAYLKPH